MTRSLRLSFPGRASRSFAGAVFGLAIPTLACGALSASAFADVLVAKPADPNEKGDGTMGPDARAAFIRGPLPMDAAKLAAAKAAAERAYEEAVRTGKLRPTGAGKGPSRAPSIVGGVNFEGQFDANVTPSDSTGAVGTTRYIQLVNEIFAIYDKSSTTPLATGTLDSFAGVSATVASFDPQIIWDPKTKRFYYGMDSIFSSTDNRLSFGFSKTASPSSAADFCHYTVSYGVPFPDYPKLGDSKDFAIFGVNTFANNSSGGFVGADLLAGLKPPSGSSCPASVSFSKKANLKDTSGFQVFTPVPANEIDDNPTGYAITENGTLPATKLWLFKVTNDGSGNPKFGGAKGVTVASYTFPPSAKQGGGFTQTMDTLDARNTQAIVAKNPARGDALSFWTQHTIANGVLSGVRWYEIDPVGHSVLRSDTLVESGNFLYNAAISPDRQVKGTTKQFGDSFVIGYTISSQTNNINPGNAMVSSLHGGAVSAGVTVKTAGGPYRDFFCPNSGNVCRWGDYSSASPDPDPSGSGEGNVWLTNQFAGGGTSTAIANWRTEIWRAKP
jgi:hypothetical protein